MTPPLETVAEVEAYLTQFDPNEWVRDKRLAYLSELVGIFRMPCGSCHPCTNYSDETWRAADRKPPHVYEWDEAQAALARVRELRDHWLKHNHDDPWAQKLDEALRSEHDGEVPSS